MHSEAIAPPDNDDSVGLSAAFGGAISPTTTSRIPMQAAQEESLMEGDGSRMGGGQSEFVRGSSDRSNREASLGEVQASRRRDKQR